MTPLVSVLTPCYNGEKFIDRYFESVLNQTCTDFEIILVNDGSTDKSEELILKYRDLLTEKGIGFQYIYKENGGQSSAINAGLKVFKGKYLTWPDIDDQMHKDYIEKKLAYMEKHPETDLLITKSATINLNNPDVVLNYAWENPPKTNEELFDRLLNSRDFRYEPGSFMVRSDSFKAYNPSLHIYDECGKWSGPQIQMLMPIIYHGNFGYLDECLFDYYLHDNNDHNKYQTGKELQQKYKESVNVLFAAIKSLNLDKKLEDNYCNIVKNRIELKALQQAYIKGNKEWYKELMHDIDKKQLSYKHYFKYILIIIPFLKKIIKVIKNK